MDLQQQILKKLEIMDGKITAIDTALQGDESRGVLGIKQHIATLKDDFTEHTKSDEKQFNELKEKVSRAAWMFAGISLTVSGIFVIAGLIISYYK